jgi:hypothetical protein
LAFDGLRELAAVDGKVSNGVLRRQWAPLLPQAALLADLSSESLEEILDHAAAAQPAEWEAEFPVRYRGKAVVFDVELSGPAGGPYRHSWALPQGTRMDFEELELLRRLPLEDPTRILFGARLDRVHRVGTAGWEIRFAPTSGVLLTDPGAAAVCCPYTAEGDLIRLLERQAAWLP